MIGLFSKFIENYKKRNVLIKYILAYDAQPPPYSSQQGPSVIGQQPQPMIIVQQVRNDVTLLDGKEARVTQQPIHYE